MFVNGFVHQWDIILLIIGIIGLIFGIIRWRLYHRADRLKNNFSKLIIIFSLIIIILSLVSNYIVYSKNSSILTKNQESNCAKTGEKFSSVYDEYPKNCCDGLNEWQSGMDTSISIGDSCYQTGAASGSPVGTCINCGDNLCSSIENPCNCPLDCKNGKNADYGSVVDFCATSKTLLKNACEGDEKKEICNLCVSSY